LKRPSSTRPQPEVVFFTDRDLGRIIPDALRRAGFRVERHDDHFGPTTPDIRWLRTVGKNGWVALTRNKNIRYNSEERDMVMEAGVALFMLVGRHPHRVLAQNLVQTMPKIVHFIATHQPPYIAKVYKPRDERFHAGKPGRVVLWLSYHNWRKRRHG
jgi:hypothetical protein